MGHKLNIISERGETISIDPNLLFQRLTAIATHGTTDMEHVFKFELCPYPASVAYSPLDPLPADKPKLFESLQKHASTDFPGRELDVQYVLDGGDLIFKMGDWKKMSTYQQIAEKCAGYVIRHYGKESIVV